MLSAVDAACPSVVLVAEPTFSSGTVHAPHELRRYVKANSMDNFATIMNDTKRPGILGIESHQSLPSAHPPALIVVESSTDPAAMDSINSMTFDRRTSDDGPMWLICCQPGLTCDPAVKREPNHPADYQSANILLVDDDVVDRMAFRRSLKTLRIANVITEAGNGIDALELLRTKNIINHPDSAVVVFLDLDMPGMSGIEFLWELRRDVLLHSIGVFVLTSSSTDERLVRAASHNVMGFVNKNELAQDLEALLAVPERSSAVTGATPPDRRWDA